MTIKKEIENALQKLKSSNNLESENIQIPWKGNKSFSVECERVTKNLVEEEELNGTHLFEGEILGFDVYYRVNGKDVDSCSISYLLDKEELDALDDLISMYR